MKTMTVKMDRVIPASPAAVYKAWLDPKMSANPWYGSDKLVWKPQVHGLFYFAHLKSGGKHPHYGQFLVLKPGKRIQSTWMSPHTRGLESLVTVDFKKKGPGTLVSLRHSNLPADAEGRLHIEGWKGCIGMLEELMKKKR
jgi:uncharacterized protein YndB with AHSA1/START domain